MKQIRMTRNIYQAMKIDLSRSHPFAFERVGFAFVKPVGNSVLCVVGYEQIPDDFYIKDNTVGARIDHRGIAVAMKRADMNNEGILHVHIHNFLGHPHFSRIDIGDHENFIRSFRNANSQMPHGVLLLSNDKMLARIWLPESKYFEDTNRYTIVGLPIVYEW
jgi:hypothetical protein